jgi:hypothetical protein
MGASLFGSYETRHESAGAFVSAVVAHGNLRSPQLTICAGLIGSGSNTSVMQEYAHVSSKQKRARMQEYARPSSPGVGPVGP